MMNAHRVFTVPQILVVPTVRDLTFPAGVNNVFGSGLTFRPYRGGMVFERSLAGGLVFPLVRGCTRGGCFHYIGWSALSGLGDGGLARGVGVDSD